MEPRGGSLRDTAVSGTRSLSRNLDCDLLSGEHDSAFYSIEDYAHVLQHWERLVNGLKAMEAMYVDATTDMVIVHADAQQPQGRLIVCPENEATKSSGHIRSFYQRFRDVLERGNFMLVHPRATRVRLEKIVIACDQLAGSSFSSAFQAQVKQLYVDFCQDPLIVILFVQPCCYESTHVGFLFRLHPKYPSAMLHPSLLIAAFCDADWTSLAFPPDDEHDVVVLYPVSSISSPQDTPPICSFPMRALDDMQQGLREACRPAEPLEIMFLVVQQGQEALSDIVCQLQRKDEEFQKYLEKLQQSGGRNTSNDGTTMNDDEKKEEEEEEDEEEEEENFHTHSIINGDTDLLARRTTSSSLPCTVFGRRLFYSHHILSTVKRDLILKWAVELGLGGISKIGYPGIVVVEGPEEACQIYHSLLQRLRWRYFACRGEQTIQCSSADQVEACRALPHGMLELGPNRMDEVARLCRDAGLRDLFLTSMKIYERSNASNTSSAGRPQSRSNKVTRQ